MTTDLFIFMNTLIKNSTQIILAAEIIINTTFLIRDGNGEENLKILARGAP